MSKLVSCILATRNRPEFFRYALRCFLSQTYQPAELIVVDDGEQPVADQCAGVERVRYLRLPQPAPLGAKLNLGIEQAQGGILQKLDDDDYYHPGFLQLAVEHLPRDRPDRSLAAWDSFLVLLPGEKQVRHSGCGWAAGGTLCFDRRLWQRRRFRNLPCSVDHWFLLDHRPDVVLVDAPEYYLLVRHGANTWSKMDDGGRVDDYFRGLPVYPKPLHALVGPLHCAFYESLARASPRQLVSPLT
ncbi:MAG TPA: glycosyltransferase family 2 protein [Bryobacterales bacterium]|nr:glycosyltransferase family 2 protein [Bryobacterales bacterium]